MPQTSISERMSKAYAGQITCAGPNYCYSASAEGASVVAGMPVQRGTLPQTQVKPFVAGDRPSFSNFGGFVVLDTSRRYDALAIEDGNPLDVMREGHMFLAFSAAVTAGQRVGLTLASGLLTGVSAGVAPGSGVVILPGCLIVETISAAGLATVEIDLPLDAASDAMPALGTLTAFAAGTTAVVTQPASGAIYDVPTTAAASTIVLPADAQEGTVLNFVADGTKNGHTVQYIVATGSVAITTALTASKRHQVRAIHLNDKWTAIAYVSP